MSASQLLSETYALLKELWRDKATFFWAILFPLVYLSLFTGIFGGSSGSNVSFSIAIQDLDGGSFSNILISALNESRIFRVSIVNQSIEEALRSGRYDAGLTILPGSSSNFSSLQRIWIKIAYVEGIQGSDVAYNALQGFLTAFNFNISSSMIDHVKQHLPPSLPQQVRAFFDFISMPISIETAKISRKPSSDPGYVRAWFVIATSGIMVLYNGIFGALGTTVDMRYRGHHRLILSSPIRGLTAFLSSAIAIMVLNSITMGVIFAFGAILGANYSNIDPQGVLIIASFLTIALLGSFGIGMLLSILAKSSEAINAIGNAVAFPTMFLTGIAIPKFMLPSWLAPLSDLFPLSRVIEGLRNYIVYSWDLSIAISYSLPGIIACLVLFTAGAMIYRRTLEAIERTL